MQLFLKSNRVMETDDRITVILACLRGGVAGIYTKKKLNELDEEFGTQNWDNFVKEIKTMFSDKIKAADAEWKIKTFKQGKRNMVDFMIKFKVLAMKANTDELYAIFLLKKNVRQDIIKMILDYPPITAPETLKEWKIAITLVEQEYESTEGQHDYKTSTGITYGGQGQPMDIRKSNNNFRTGSLSDSIATSMAMWQKNADLRRKNEKHELVSNVTRKGTLPKTVKEYSR